MPNHFGIFIVNFEQVNSTWFNYDKTCLFYKSSYFFVPVDILKPENKGRFNFLGNRICLLHFKLF